MNPILNLTRIKNAQKINLWQFGNEILYKLCNDQFEHKIDKYILTKVLFIGRIYAAAVERRKNKNKIQNDDFYTDEIIPVFKKSNIDDRLTKLKNMNFMDSNTIKYALETHDYLVNILHEITDQNKRSFSSKYLHFHIPEMFFIYDSRATKGIRKFINKIPLEHQSILKLNNIDIEYAKFYIKCFELKKQITLNYRIDLTNREIDNLLINIKNS
jgi:hypothetical protein